MALDSDAQSLRPLPAFLDMHEHHTTGGGLWLPRGEGHLMQLSAGKRSPWATLAEETRDGQINSVSIFPFDELFPLLFIA